VCLQHTDVFEILMGVEKTMSKHTVNIALIYARSRRNTAFVRRLLECEQADPNYIYTSNSSQSIPLVIAIEKDCLGVSIFSLVTLNVN